MRAKHYLLQIQKMDRMIQNKIAEAEHWKSIAAGTGLNTGGERVQSQGSQQKMADAVGRYIDIEKEITAAIDRLIDLRREIIQTIEQLKNVDHYDILYKRYVLYKEYFEIADDMKKSQSWVAKAHGKALLDIQRILDERGAADESTMFRLP